jgi:hypothetical protein
MASGGRAYAVYLHLPIPEKVKSEDLLKDRTRAALVLDLPAGSYQCEWIDTKTGDVASRDEFRHAGGNEALESSPFAGDVALRVVAK